jgi:hypothetical protein
MSKTTVIYNAASKYPDPAIDQTKSNIKEYRKSFDASKLVFVEGSQPIKFTVKKLTMNELSIIRQFSEQKGDNFGSLKSLTHGLLSYSLSDGTVVTPNRIIGPDGLSYFKDMEEELEKLSDEFGEDTLYEIGSAIFHSSGLPKNLSPFLSK